MGGGEEGRLGRLGFICLMDCADGDDLDDGSTASGGILYARAPRLIASPYRSGIYCPPRWRYRRQSQQAALPPLGFRSKFITALKGLQLYSCTTESASSAQLTHAQAGMQHLQYAAIAPVIS